MLEPFTVENKSGEKFFIGCKRCVPCWELMIHTQTNKSIGFLRFTREDADSIKIWDFQIEKEFSSNGLGTQILSKLFCLFKERGFSSVVGICKSSNRDLSEKAKLANWYKRLGFILTPESDNDTPGYMGKLVKKI